MRDLAALWSRVGDVVWVRFRALGVPEPAEATRAWLAAPEQAWIPASGSVDAARLWVTATRFALAHSAGAPDPEAVAPFCCGPAAVRHVLAASGPVREAAVFTVIDGFDIDETANLLGLTPTAIQLGAVGLDDEIAQADEPLPPGSASEGHPNTLRLHGFVREDLPPLAMRQVEEHIHHCAWCLGRFAAWGELRAAFDSLPVPSQQLGRARSPVWGVALVGVISVALLIAGVAAVVLVGDPGSGPEAVAWDGSAAEVELRVGGSALASGRPAVGALVEIRVDARGAGQVTVARRIGPEIDAFVTLPSAGRGMHAVPLELVAIDAPDQSLIVALSDGPLTRADLIRAANGGLAGVTVVERPL